MLADLGALTVMFLFVYMFGINVAAPYTFGYVTIAQIVPLYALNILKPTTGMPAAYNLVKFLLSLYSMWSLDVFSIFIPPLCCIRNVTNMTVIAYKYIGAVYPLFLVLGSYFVLKLHQWNVKAIVVMTWPIRTCFQLMRIEMDSRSLLTTFCTFVSLAFVKVSIISFQLLCSEDIHNETGELVGTVLLYDGSIAFWGPEHLVHAVIAIFVLVVLLFLCLVLILYPLCNIQRFLSGRGCSARHVQYISALMEVFYGHFKDGTGGTRDYRFLGGMQFLFKFLLFCSIFFGPTKINEESNFFVVEIGTMLWAFFIIILQPYKNENHAKFHAAVMLYLSIAMSVGIYVTVSASMSAQVIFFLLFSFPPLAVIVISGLVMLLPKLQQCSICRRRNLPNVSISLKIVSSIRSMDRSQQFTDDRLATYAPVPTAEENDK